MPHRRVKKKGSFGGHFDELVKHFPDDDAKPAEAEQDGAEREDPYINDKLFECAWRKAREADQARRFSNQ